MIIQQESGKTYIGWYLVSVGILLVFLELIWIINKSACCSHQGCCCQCWALLLWVDNWKKGILYLALSVPVFLEGMRLILGIVSGFFLIILGLLYIVKTFQYGIIYTREETRYVKTTTPAMNTVAHEISTQTTDDEYYQKISVTDTSSIHTFN